MFIKKIAGFILVLFLLSSAVGFSQDTLTWTRGLRFGYDLSRVAQYYLQPDRKAMEFSFDTEYKEDKFFTIEAGVEQSQKNSDVISYKSNGYYGRVGFDYNFLGRDKLEKGHDIVFIGLRYGYFNLNQTLNKYMIPSYYPSDTAWGSYPSKNLSGHWIEAVFGLKVEIVKNLFMGASLRGKVLLYSTKADNYPYFMPGYGKRANGANFGINYSIYYQIPIKKVKYKQAEPKKQPKKK